MAEKESEGTRKINFIEDPSEGTHHPVGKTVGTVAGAAAGAFAGSPGGPISTVAGAVIGGVVGYLEGKTYAEAFHPEKEIEFWKQHFPQTKEGKAGRHWDEYEHVYGFGVRSFNPNRKFEDAEPQLRAAWEAPEKKTPHRWDEIKYSIQEVWVRLQEMVGM